MIESLNAIIKLLTEGNGAIVVAGALTVPVANLLRGFGDRWEWFSLKVKGIWMLVAVIGVSAVIVGIGSLVPAVGIEFSVGPCLLAAATAVLVREAHKHGLGKK